MAYTEIIFSEKQFYITYMYVLIITINKKKIKKLNDFNLKKLNLVKIKYFIWLNK